MGSFQTGEVPATGEAGTCDEVPANVLNACGIHIHVGTSCAVAGSVGGHFWNEENAPDDDPWSPISYTTDTGSSGQADGNTAVMITEDRSAISGRAFVVHDSTGGRIGCGLIPAEELVRLMAV